MNKQILQYLSGVIQDKTDLKIEVINNHKILKIEGQYDNSLTLPMLDPSFLQSHEICVDCLDKSFLVVAWETLTMIKENMPAHFDIGVNEGSKAASELGYGSAQDNHFMAME